MPARKKPTRKRPSARAKPPGLPRSLATLAAATQQLEAAGVRPEYVAHLLVADGLRRVDSQLSSFLQMVRDGSASTYEEDGDEFHLPVGAIRIEPQLTDIHLTIGSRACIRLSPAEARDLAEKLDHAADKIPLQPSRPLA